MKSIGWIWTAWMLLPLAGCASLTDFHYEQTQRSRARTAWHEHGAATMPSSYGRDYRSGWKDGFYDVATGGKGCPPVVAPCHYWKPAQILEDCDQARHAYYSGFQDGVAAALQYPQTHYVKLWASCECPLPVCENQCCPTVSCPGEACGLIVQDAIDAAVPYPAVPPYPAAVPFNIQQPERVIEVIDQPESIREAIPYQIEPVQPQATTTQPGRDLVVGSATKSAVSDQPESIREAIPYQIEPVQPQATTAQAGRDLAVSKAATSAVVERMASIREAIPYQINPARPQAAAVPSQNPEPSEPATSPAKGAESTPRSIGIEAAQPYHLDVKLRQQSLPPAGHVPAAFPGQMIEDDRGRVAPCSLLQEAP